MATPQEELLEYAKTLAVQLTDPNLSDTEFTALKAVYQEIEDDAFAAALNNFRSVTPQFITLSTKLQAAISNLGGQRSAILTSAADGLGKVQRLVHDAEGMRTTWQSSEEAEEQFEDEKEEKPVDDAIVIPAREPGVPTLIAPRPLNTKSFAQLADEYIRYFGGAAFKNDASQNAAERFARAAIANRQRYVDAGGPLNVPWWFIAGVHLLEGSFNFTTHLHNGDALTARTHRVPAGRPRTGKPPFTWEESARDALKKQDLDNLTDWSLARALYRWEAYNGFGYRGRGIATPYLWSFTSIYGKGKFVGDGVYSPAAVSKQCGAVALLKALAGLGQVDLRIEGCSEEKAAEDTDSDGVDAARVISDGKVNIDGAISPNQEFQSFFAERLSDISHFKWHELLVKGASNRTNGLNTDPPRELWTNIAPTVRVLEKLRQEIGKPVVLTSVYRSPSYNASVGGARRSQHKEFCAIDFKVVGAGGPSDWARILRRYRDNGVFRGGVGLYNTFVHVDTRGYNANWE